MLNFFLNNAATIGTILFFTIFCYVIFFALNKKNKKSFDDSAQIPFREKEK